MVMMTLMVTVLVTVLVPVTVMDSSLQPVFCSHHRENVGFALPVKHCQSVGHRVYGGDVQWLWQ